MSKLMGMWRALFWVLVLVVVVESRDLPLDVVRPTAGSKACAIKNHKNHHKPAKSNALKDQTTLQTTTATTTSSVSSTSTTSEFPYATLCQEDGRTNETFYESGAYLWGPYLANTIPQNNSKTWFNYLADYNKVDYDCILAFGGVCIVISVPADCSYPQTARTYFWTVMTAQFFAALNYLLDAMVKGQVDESTIQDSFSENFLSQSIDVTAAILEAIGSAIVGSVASMIVPFLSKLVTMATREVAIVTETLKSLSSTINEALGSVGAVIARDFKVEGTIQEIYSQLTNTSTVALEYYADQLYNYVPTNPTDYEDYGADPRGLPQILKTGLWANQITSEDVQNMQLTQSNGVGASVITWYIEAKGGYPVFTKNMTVYGGDTCGADLTDGLIRECFTMDGETIAAFLLLQGYTLVRKGSKKITGFNNSTLQQYSLSTTSLFRAWYKSFVVNGGDRWSISSAVGYASTVYSDEEYLYASLPACNLTEANITAAEAITKRTFIAPDPFNCASDGCKFKMIVAEACEGQQGLKFT